MHQKCVYLNLVGVNDGSHQLVFDKQLVSAVRLALESRILFHRVIRTKGGRRRFLQWLEVFYKDERLKNGPEGRNKAQKN